MVTNRFNFNFDPNQQPDWDSQFSPSASQEENFRRMNEVLTELMHLTAACFPVGRGTAAFTITVDPPDTPENN